MTESETIKEWDRQVAEWRKVYIETKYSFEAPYPPLPSTCLNDFPIPLPRVPFNCNG